MNNEWFVNSVRIPCYENGDYKGGDDLRDTLVVDKESVDGLLEKLGLLFKHATDPLENIDGNTRIYRICDKTMERKSCSFRDYEVIMVEMECIRKVNKE